MAITITPAAPLNAEALLPMELIQLQLKLDDEDDRLPLATALRSAALMWVEKRVGRSLQRRAWAATFDNFSDGLRLPMGPIWAVTALTYTDQAGVLQTWPSTSYQLVGSELVTVSGLSLRAAFADMAITIQYDAGYQQLSVDAPNLQAAILLLLMHLWVGGSLNDVPATVFLLCDTDRTPVIG